MNDKSATRPWYEKAFVYLVGIVASALVGSFVRGYLERAKPNLEVASVEVVTPSSAQLAVNAALDGLGSTGARVDGLPSLPLLDLTEASTWLPAFKRGGRYGEYLVYLAATRRQAETLAAAMERLRGDLARWPTVLDAQAGLDVYEILRANEGLILGHLFGEARRGRQVFEGEAPPGLVQEPIVDVGTDKDGDLYLDHGIRRFPVVWSVRAHTSEERDRCKALAHRLARAVRLVVKEDLARLRRELDALLSEDSQIREVLRLVDKELELASSIVLRLIIANRGKESLALDPRALLYVYTRDVDYKNGEGRPASMAGDLRFELENVTLVSRSAMVEGENVEAEVVEFSRRPVVVEGGRAITVSFATRERLGALENGREFLDVFRGPGAEAIVGLRALTGEIGERLSGVVLSPRFVARDIGYDRIFPDELFYRLSSAPPGDAPAR